MKICSEVNKYIYISISSFKDDKIFDIPNSYSISIMVTNLRHCWARKLFSVSATWSDRSGIPIPSVQHVTVDCLVCSGEGVSFDVSLSPNLKAISFLLNSYKLQTQTLDYTRWPWTTGFAKDNNLSRNIRSTIATSFGLYLHFNFSQVL